MEILKNYFAQQARLFNTFLSAPTMTIDDIFDKRPASLLFVSLVYVFPRI
jgi:hypothetical protein